MRIFGTMAAALGLVGAIASRGCGLVRQPSSLLHYYGGGGGTWNGCRPGWSVQGGICKPYRRGPWDFYGGRQSDYGY